jgi:hypothetical protein
MGKDIGPGQLEVDPRRAKTCAKKRKNVDIGKEKAGEASKRPKLASNPTMYLFGWISEAEAIFGRLVFTPLEEAVLLPVCQMKRETLSSRRSNSNKQTLF